MKKPRRVLGVVAQVRQACLPEHRLASGLAAVLGGFVPLASYTLARCELRGEGAFYLEPAAWLVLGALVFSAKSVFAWGRQAFACPYKAGSFVVLLEGTLVLAHTPWLGAAALVILVAINAVSTAVGLTEK